jgi:hypothetical protein
MMSVHPVPEPGSWNPDSRRGEGSTSRQSLRRRDLWFFFGILAFFVLLFFVWQQHRGLRLADEVAHLEAQRESMGIRLVEMEVEVTRLSQPDLLFKNRELARLDADLAERRIFVAAAAPDDERNSTRREALLAGMGLEISPAFADRP